MLHPVIGGLRVVDVTTVATLIGRIGPWSRFAYVFMERPHSFRGTVDISFLVGHRFPHVSVECSAKVSGQGGRVNIARRKGWIFC